jgi:hypothetical protein
MMKAADPQFEEERKWVKSVIQPGMSLQAAEDALRMRFKPRDKATGIAVLAGLTKVHDFESSLSEVRLVSKFDSIVSVRVQVLYSKKMKVRVPK